MSDETRGTGRTTAMIEAAKAAHERGVRVIVVGHTTGYAAGLANRIGWAEVEFASIDTIGERLRGSNAVPFVDHFAVEQWASAIYDAHVRARDAWAENERLHRELDTVKQSLVRQSQRLHASRNEAKRWRDRCPVTAADVEAAGVTAEQCEAFLLANGGVYYEASRLAEVPREHAVGILSPPITPPGGGQQERWTWLEYVDPESGDIADACNCYGKSTRTPAQDVLVAMQRTEVG